MKVEYLQCDICGNRITDRKEDRFIFSHLKTFPGSITDICEEVKYDICNACFRRMKDWCEEERKKNGTNT